MKPLRDDVIDSLLSNVGCTEAQVAASLEKFRRFSAEALRHVFPGSDVTEMDGQSIRIVHPGDKVVRTIALQRMFRSIESWRVREDLRSIISSIAAAARPQDRAAEGLRAELAQIVPLLKTQAYAAGNAAVLRRQAVERGKDPEATKKVAWDTDLGLVAFAVVNDPDKFSFITVDRLSESGLSEEDIQDVAMANLRLLMRNMEDSGDYAQGHKEVAGVDGVASSLLLLDEFLQREAAHAEDDLVIFSGSPDHLFLVPVSNADFIDFMVQRVGSGTLKLGEIPPLLYADGRVEILGIAASDPEQQAEPPKRYH